MQGTSYRKIAESFGSSSSVALDAAQSTAAEKLGLVKQTLAEEGKSGGDEC